MEKPMTPYKHEVHINLNDRPLCLVSLTDYDADLLLLTDIIRDVLRESDFDPDKDDADALEEVVDELRQYAESESPSIKDGLEWASQEMQGDYYTTDALRRLLDADPELALHAARELLADREMPPKARMLAVGQFRYLQRVAEARITAVFFVKPVASAVWRDLEKDEDLDERWPGFTVGSYEDFEPEFEYEEVWRGREMSAAPEYHGTTLARLLIVAPTISTQLPTPPSPPLNREAFVAMSAALRS